MNLNNISNSYLEKEVCSETARTYSLAFELQLLISQLRYCLRGARAAILCYAVTDAESWERLQFWVSFAQN